MPRVFISRLLETFFRRKWLYVLPIVVLLGLGVFSVLQSHSKYRSIGVIEVNRQTVLGSATDTDQGPNFGNDTPAAYIARRINTVLDTEVFMDSVIESAQLTEAADSGAVDPRKLRRSIAAVAQGDELVTVQAVTTDPELSYRLAYATIDAYRGYEIRNRTEDASAAVDSLDERIANQRETIKTLTDTTQNSQARGVLADLLASREVAATVRDTAAADIAARFPTVDEPDQPTAPEPRRKQDAQTLVLFFTLGVLVSGAAVVVGTFMDRTVRYSSEVEAQLHVPVLATVPDSPSALTPSVI